MASTRDESRAGSSSQGFPLWGSQFPYSFTPDGSLDEAKTLARYRRHLRCRNPTYIFRPAALQAQVDDMKSAFEVRRGQQTG